MSHNKEIPHGTNSKYTADKCRCDACRKANSDYGKERRRQVRTGERLVVHGNMNSYKTGCRCEECKLANKLWLEEYKNRRLESGDITHGTGSGYQIFKCRCAECTAWQAFHARKNWLKSIYGITLDDFLSMLHKQGNKCASCSDIFLTSHGTHIDHNHETGKVRALLCRNCNLALGFLRDDPKRIKKLKNYILKYKM